MINEHEWLKFNKYTSGSAGWEIPFITSSKIDTLYSDHIHKNVLCVPDTSYRSVLTQPMGFNPLAMPPHDLAHLLNLIFLFEEKQLMTHFCSNGVSVEWTNNIL